MFELKENDLKSVQGGFGGWAAVGIIGGIIFLIGVIDGYIRPLKCNK